MEVALMPGTRKKCATPCPHKDDIGGGKFCKLNKEFDGKPPCPKPQDKIEKRKILRELWQGLNEDR